MDKTIEQRVSETILQQQETITVGEKEYTVSPPSVATLILASEAVSHLPRVVLDPDNVVEESLSVAKDCRVLGEIVAVLILGAKHINEKISTPQIKGKCRLWWLFNKWSKSETRKEALTRELLENVTPSELNVLVAKLLSKMDLSDFFGLTTFLIEINLLRQTKVESETTAFGQ